METFPPGCIHGAGELCFLYLPGLSQSTNYRLLKVHELSHVYLSPGPLIWASTRPHSGLPVHRQQTRAYTHTLTTHTRKERGGGGTYWLMPST